MPASVSVSGKSSTSNYMNINNTIMKIKDILLMAAVATAALTGCGSKENKVPLLSLNSAHSIRPHLTSSSFFATRPFMQA